MRTWTFISYFMKYCLADLRNTFNLIIKIIFSLSINAYHIIMMTYAELYLPTLSSPIFSSSCWCTTLYTKHARLTFCLIHNIYTDMYLSSYYISIQHILLFLDTICECVRSNSNFHPQNQDVDFDMLKMLFSFQCAKYDKNRRLNTKLKKKET